jgi:hypothetical protein
MSQLSITFDGPLANIASRNPSQHRLTQASFHVLALFQTDDASVSCRWRLTPSGRMRPHFPFTGSWPLDRKRAYR